MSNFKHEDLGIICSGLSVKLLNEALSARFANNKFFRYIKLENSVNYKPNQLQTNLTAKIILESFFSNKDVVVHRVLKRYPILVEMSIKPNYFNKSLGINLVLYIGFFIIFIVFVYIFLNIARDYFQGSLFKLQNKLNQLKLIKENSTNQATFLEAPTVNQLDLDQFANDVDDFINTVYALHTEARRLPELEIKKKVLNLVLTERHFLAHNSNRVTNEAKLYLNKLESIIDEEFITLSLEEFLKQAIDYYSEFYYEFKIKLIVQKKNQRKFTFKHASLTEVIFHILTFISRVSFDVKNNEIILKGFFVDGAELPSITLEIDIINNASGDNKALGWLSGPSYAYTSLLSIYLLARENKLFFDLIKKDNKITFILEPIDKKIDFYNKAFESEILEKL